VREYGEEKPQIPPLRYGPTASRGRRDDNSVGELTERRPLCGSRGALQVPRLPPDFLSGLVAPVNFMRLSLRKAAYVAVYGSSVVGNPECARDDKWRVVAFIKGRSIGWTEGRQVPQLHCSWSPDLLFGPLNVCLRGVRASSRYNMVHAASLEPAGLAHACQASGRFTSW
jgi:hypothetical protein